MLFLLFSVAAYSQSVLSSTSPSHLAYCISHHNWHCPTKFQCYMLEMYIFGPLVKLCWSIPIHEVKVAIRMAGQPENLQSF